MERVLKKGAKKAALILIVVTTIAGCAGLTASQKFYLQQNPDCWYDENDEPMCPSPFEREIKKESDLLIKSSR